MVGACDRLYGKACPCAQIGHWDPVPIFAACLSCTLTMVAWVLCLIIDHGKSMLSCGPGLQSWLQARLWTFALCCYLTCIACVCHACIRHRQQTLVPVFLILTLPRLACWSSNPRRRYLTKSMHNRRHFRVLTSTAPCPNSFGELPVNVVAASLWPICDAQLS